MRKAALYRWVTCLFLGICLIVMAFVGVTLLKSSVIRPLTAEAASVYWSTPSTCPSCGASDDLYQSTSFTRVSGCTYSYKHMYMSNPNPMCSGTVTIHSPYTEAAQEATCTTPGHSAAVRCSSCGAYQSTPSTTPALGHDYGEWARPGTAGVPKQRLFGKGNTYNCCYGPQL